MTGAMSEFLPSTIGTLLKNGRLMPAGDWIIHKWISLLISTRFCMIILRKEARLMPPIWLSEVQQLTNRICNRISLWEPVTDLMMTGRQGLLFRPILEHRQQLNYLPTVSITEHSDMRKAIRI